MGQSDLTRLYHADALITGAQVTLDDKARHFLLHVLRAERGQTVLLFNARDGEYRATVATYGKKDLTVIIGPQTRTPLAEPDLWLCFAPIKKTPADFLAQKAAELGVACLVPTLTARTIVTRVNTDRLAANAIEGAEQTGRLSIPVIRAPVRLVDLVAQWPQDRRLMLADESGTSPPVLAALHAAGGRGAPWAVLIGPEGGFTPQELQLLKSLPQTVSVGLGPRVLRADTAALAAVSAWQMVLGDWDVPR